MSNNLSKSIRMIFATITTALLVACGGGGGGGGGDAAGGGGAAGAAATLNPFEFKADSALEMASMNMTIQELLEGMGFVGSTFRDIYAVLNTLVAGAPQNVTCDALRNFPGSGTATVTWTDVDGDTFKSAGDTFRIDFTNCRDSLYGWDITSGRIILTLNSETGLAGGVPSEMDADLDFRNVVVTLNDVVLTLNNGVTNIDFNAQGVATDTYDATGTRLNISGVQASGETFNSTIRNYNFALTIDCAAVCLPYTNEINAELEVKDLTYLPGGVPPMQSVSGTADVATTTTFEGSGTNRPTVGVMKLTGAANSSVTSTADNNGINVAIDTDEDGDNITDVTENVVWDDLFYD